MYLILVAFLGLTRQRFTVADGLEAELLGATLWPLQEPQEPVQDRRHTLSPPARAPVARGGRPGGYGGALDDKARGRAGRWVARNGHKGGERELMRALGRLLREQRNGLRDLTAG